MQHSTCNKTIRQTFRSKPTGSHQRIEPASLHRAQVGKLISQVDIPPFIPRPDLLEQLVRWALSTCQLDGAANFGMPMRVEPFQNSKGDDWGCAKP